jgi:hypothetical protein
MLDVRPAAAMNRLDPGDQPRDSDEALARLHRAGWSIGDAAFAVEGGGLLRVVSGHKGEDLIRAQGPTRDEAWGRAVGQARGLGMRG